MEEQPKGVPVEPSPIAGSPAEAKEEEKQTEVQKPAETAPAVEPKQIEEKESVLLEDLRGKAEEGRLYTVLIIALIIGIVIVIATLILSRPAPEYFSELYFENPSDLPKFNSPNIFYNYTFTIANHGNSSRGYSISTRESLYAFNYSCESPAMYFDEQSLGANNYSRKTAETKDPVALIREENYSFSFEYRIKPNLTGRFESLNLTFRDINGRDRYSMIIDEKQKEALYMRDGELLAEKGLNLSNSTRRSVSFSATKKSLRLSVDSKTVLEIKEPKDYTSGFMSFQLTGVNTEIPWITLTDGKSKINNVLKSKSQSCKLIPLKTISSQQDAFIEKDKSQSISQSFMLNDSFDIAEVQVSLDSGEEIHFWSAQT